MFTGAPTVLNVITLIETRSSVNVLIRCRLIRTCSSVGGLRRLSTRIMTLLALAVMVVRHAEPKIECASQIGESTVSLLGLVQRLLDRPETELLQRGKSI